MHDIAVVVVLLAACTATAVYLLRTRPPRLAPPSNPAMAFGAGTLAVILICLLPAWTSGRL
jgi:hypothetical protein